MGHASPCYSRWSIAGLLVALIGLGAPANAHAQRYLVTDLGTLGGGSSTGYAINANGQVTGVAVTANGRLHAFLYTSGNGMIELGTLGGGTSKGYGINASGQVTGEVVTAGSAFHAFLYTSGDGMIDLGTLGGGESKGNGINASGQVTGDAVTTNGALHAFLYAKRVMLDLNSMIDPVIAAHVTLFSGKGINDDGWIVANGADSRTDMTHAYLLSKH